MMMMMMKRRKNMNPQTLPHISTTARLPDTETFRRPQQAATRETSIEAPLIPPQTL